MDLQTSNEYLRLSALHEPFLIEMCGADPEKVRGNRTLLAHFARAMGGDEASYKELEAFYPQIWAIPFAQEHILPLISGAEKVCHPERYHS